MIAIDYLVFFVELSDGDSKRLRGKGLGGLCRLRDHQKFKKN